MAKRYIIETIKTIGDYKYVVIFSNMGHRCGYVAIKPNHPLFGVEYNQDIKSPELLQEIKASPIGKRGIIDALCWDGEKTSLSMLINVHGSLTYSALGYKTNYPTIQFDKVWWFGFDCAHYGDAKDTEKLKATFPAQYKTLKEHDLFYDSGIVRSLDYVENECINLIDQLTCIKDTLAETRILLAQ